MRFVALWKGINVGGKHDITRSIETAFEDRFGFNSKCFVYSAETFQALLEGSPYTSGSDYFVFLERAITLTENQTLMVSSKLAPSEVVTFHSRVIYMDCPEGYGKTKVTPAVIERALKVQTTTRNRKTVIALDQLLRSETL